jgi:SpoIID/LytB domain protein
MRRNPTVLALGGALAGLILSTTGALPASGSAASAAQAAAASVRVDQTYPMPASGSIEMTGHGFGHGHGMSQYGAEGAARQGKSWGQILDFYYPGTSFGSSKGRISVLISANTSRFTTVEPRRGLRVKNVTTRESRTLPDKGASRWRLAVSSNGDSRIEYLTDRWRIWKTWPGLLEFYAGGLSLRLFIGDTAVRYRGTMRSAIPEPGTIRRQTVNVVNIEHYLYGVVAKEMPASWSPDAVRSQAVAARTYAVRQKRSPLTRTYQICDTTACQVYGGVPFEDRRSNAAVDATEHRILTYEGRPAFTQFSSSSGGWTAASSVPYMPAQRDPYDGWSGNRNHTWTMDLDVAKVERAWSSIGDLEAIRIVSRTGDGEWGGRVDSMVLVGSERELSIRGTEFRSKLGLRSTWFEFDQLPAASRS